MPLFILTESSAGYGLFKASDKKLLEQDESTIRARLSTIEKITKEVQYKHFQKFDSAQSALEEIAGVIEGKVTPNLTSLLQEFKNEKKITLAVSDTKLGASIGKLPELNIKTISDSTTTDLFRAMRKHMPDLIPGMVPENFQEMSLGLAHSLSRHKLKFSPDKVDVMIVHAVSLLDDIDKELNTFAMRVKEWYGWHFPELAKILPDNLSYMRVITTMGMRDKAAETDLSEILPTEIETAVKMAADISMGTEISPEDLINIVELADIVIAYATYRRQLAEYLENRMRAISPNMAELVGALVGARLIAHAGSLMNLAKNPGSTIQILGAEKALFRALKTKHATPKYGLIYHASLVGQASVPNKGKIARQLAAKVALGVRTDALGEFEENADDDTRAAVGITSRLKLERSLRHLEGRPIASKGHLIGPNGMALGQPAKWDIKEARKYNHDADGVVTEEPKKPLIEEVIDTSMADGEADDQSDDEMENAPPQNGVSIQAEKTVKKSGERKRSEREERRLGKARHEVTAVQTAAETPAKPTARPVGYEDIPKKLDEADMERLAKEAGLSVKKFTRRYERGLVKLTAGGKLEVLSKKDVKMDKVDKDGEDDGQLDGKSKGSKRKHEADGEDGKDTPSKENKPKKKKKHQKESA